MKFTELYDYPLPGGIVTEWVPATESDPQHWTSDPRPLTYDHEAALRSRTDRRSNETSWLGAVFEINRRYDPECLRRALQRWMIRHEAFLTIADLAIGRRTCRAADLTMDAEMIGHVESGTQVTQILTRSFDEHLSPLTWPHVRVASITSLSSVSADDRFAVVFAADHVVMDAYSIMLSINEICVLYRAEIDRTAAELPEVGSHVDFSCDDRRTGLELTDEHPAVGSWRRFLAAQAPSTTPLSVASGPSSLETDEPATPRPQRGYSEYVADAAEADAISAHARTHGVGTQAAVFAAIALAHRTMTNNPLLQLVMPWHTRHEPRFLLSIGWYVGLGPLEVDLTDAETFTDALHATGYGIAAAREVSRAPHRRVSEILGAADEPQFVASYLDMRRVPGAADWPAMHAHTLRSASYSDREVYLWIARVPTGITLSARYPDSPIATDIVDRFTGLVATILRTVASAGTDLALEHYYACDDRTPTIRTA